MQSTPAGRDHDRQQKWKIIKHLKATRLSKDLSQDKLAGLVGCSTRTIISLEGGLIALEALLFMKICVALDLSIDELSRFVLDRGKSVGVCQKIAADRPSIPQDNARLKTIQSSTSFN